MTAFVYVIEGKINVPWSLLRHLLPRQLQGIVIHTVVLSNITAADMGR